MKNLKTFLENACEQYCENLSDQEYFCLVDGLTIKLKQYLQDTIDEM